MTEIKENCLYFDGCNMALLAKEYGTPLYVLSETGVVKRIQELKDVFVKPYPNNRIAYGAKAFFTKGFGKLLIREGIGVDVVSGGELYTAIKAGFSPEHIEFNGNNKSYSELEMAIDYGIGRIIIDNIGELALIEDICKQKGKKVKALYRITPNVKGDTHAYIVTGEKDSKFGFPLDDSLISAIQKGIQSPYIELLGLHFHLGSQLFEISPYLEALEVLLTTVTQVEERLNYHFSELNIGGGFGIQYTTQKRKPYAYFLVPIMKRIQDYYSEKNLPLPAVVTEPGRSIVGDSGLTLYTVGSIKDIPQVRKYVSVDGGMGDNIRPSLYKADYTAVVANRVEGDTQECVTICGKYCESGDILIKDITLPVIGKGDILGVLSTGAYGYSMASNYNKNPISGVVLVKEGTHEWLVRPQSYEQMIQNEVVPKSLQ